MEIDRLSSDPRSVYLLLIALSVAYHAVLSRLNPAELDEMERALLAIIAIVIPLGFSSVLIGQSAALIAFACCVAFGAIPTLGAFRRDYLKRAADKAMIRQVREEAHVQSEN